MAAGALAAFRARKNHYLVSHKNLLFIVPETPDTAPLTDRQLFSRIWLQPRPVFRFMEDWHYDRYLPLLLVLSGIRQSFVLSRPAIKTPATTSACGPSSGCVRCWAG